MDMRASDARGVVEKERDVRGANAEVRRRQRRAEGEAMVMIAPGLRILEVFEIELDVCSIWVFDIHEPLTSDLAKVALHPFTGLGNFVSRDICTTLT